MNALCAQSVEAFHQAPQPRACLDRRAAARPRGNCALGGTMQMSGSLPDLHMPPTRSVVIGDLQAERWRSMGGTELDHLLEGPIALLNAKWLIDRAAAGGVLLPRQLLPKEAFLTRDEVVAATVRDESLPVIALSHPWLHPNHPDPYSENLERIAAVLRHFVDLCPVWGVFLDFCSLHQHPDPTKSHFRSDRENELFKAGLGGLGPIYSHPHTIVLRLTSFPPGYPASYKKDGQVPLDPGAAATYYNRGWTFTESCWASLTKSSKNSLDIGHVSTAGSDLTTLAGHRGLISECTRGGERLPPLTPHKFKEQLKIKRFTNGKEDYPLVVQLYRDVFRKRFRSTTTLDYSGLGWSDELVRQLVPLIRSGVLVELRTLNLSHNAIGDDGTIALIRWLHRERAHLLPQLREINLSNNRITSRGMRAFAACIKNMPLRLSNIYLAFNTDSPFQPVFELELRNFREGMGQTDNFHKLRDFVDNADDHTLGKFTGLGEASGDAGTANATEGWQTSPRQSVIEVLPQTQAHRVVRHRSVGRSSHTAMHEALVAGFRRELLPPILADELNAAGSPPRALSHKIITQARPDAAERAAASRIPRPANVAAAASATNSSRHPPAARNRLVGSASCSSLIKPPSDSSPGMPSTASRSVARSKSGAVLVTRLHLESLEPRFRLGNSRLSRVSDESVAWRN